jgi:hypothetical protein
VTWDDNDLFDLSYHNRKPKAIKLISLLGGSDGSLNYGLHQYPDCSGAFPEIIYPCSSYDEALRMAQMEINRLSQQYLSGEKKWFDGIEKWREIEGINIPQELENRLAKNAEENRQARIQKLKNELAELGSEVS